MSLANNFFKFQHKYKSPDESKAKYLINSDQCLVTDYIIGKIEQQI